VPWQSQPLYGQSVIGAGSRTRKPALTHGAKPATANVASTIAK